MRTAALLKVVPDGVVVGYGALYPVRYDHCPCLATDLALTGDTLVEVVHHDLRLQPYGVLMSLHVAPELSLRPPGVELGIVLDLLHQVVVAVQRRVAAQHVQYESLLDRLLHRVAVERQVLRAAVRLGRGISEQLESPVLRRGGEGEVAGIREQLLRLDDLVYLILEGVVIIDFDFGRGERHRHCRRGTSTMAGMRLVDDDGEITVAEVSGYLVQDERELLHRGDDDLLAALDEFLEGCPHAVGLTRPSHSPA